MCHSVYRKLEKSAPTDKKQNKTKPKQKVTEKKPKPKHSTRSHPDVYGDIMREKERSRGAHMN